MGTGFCAAPEARRVAETCECSRATDPGNAGRRTGVGFETRSPPPARFTLEHPKSDGKMRPALPAQERGKARTFRFSLHKRGLASVRREYRCTRWVRRIWLYESNEFVLSGILSSSRPHPQVCRSDPRSRGKRQLDRPCKYAQICSSFAIPCPTVETKRHAHNLASSRPLEMESKTCPNQSVVRDANT